MKRIIRAAGYSEEAAAVNHNYYIRDEAGKIHGPYFNVIEKNLGDKKLLFVKERKDEPYKLLDENCNIKCEVEGIVYGKYILANENGKYFLLNQELEKCSEEFDKIYQEKSNDEFLTVEQNGEKFRLYSNLTKVNEKDITDLAVVSDENKELIDYFADHPEPDYFETLHEYNWRGVIGADGREMIKMSVLVFVASGGLSALMGGLILAGSPAVAASSIGLAMGSAGLIMSLIMATGDLPRTITSKNIEKRNIKKMAKTRKEMAKINKRLEKLNQRREALQKEVDDLYKEEQKRLERLAKLRERGENINKKIKGLLKELLLQKKEDIKISKIFNKAAEKEAEIKELREQLEELETESLIREAEAAHMMKARGDRLSDRYKKLFPVDKGSDEIENKAENEAESEIEAETLEAENEIKEEETEQMFDDDEDDWHF